MLNRFLNFIKTHNLISDGAKVLLAVSGGLDSMVMVDLFYRSGLSFGIGHANFQLRGEDASGDADFVVSKAMALGIPSFVKKFETHREAEIQGVSIQMAARNLRYEWFQQLAEEYQFACIATAHHLNDSLETTFLNMIKGTGISGVSGIPVKREKLIRPLLFASRQELEEYAQEQGIFWREDSSNTTDDYQRNLIRNQVIPLLRQINPSLEGGLEHTFQRLAAGALYARKYIAQLKKEVIREKSDRIVIQVTSLKKENYPAVMLWEWIKPFGFNYPQCQDMMGQSHLSGKQFFSATHQLIVDRDVFLVLPVIQEIAGEKLIEKQRGQVNWGDQTLTVECVSNQFELNTKNKYTAQLDADRLSFPLVWRPWRNGDQFVPLGMRNHKKVSDFLVDNKVSVLDKKRITVVESNGEIVWVVGWRIANPFKIEEGTKHVFMMTLEHNT